MFGAMNLIGGAMKGAKGMFDTFQEGRKKDKNREMGYGANDTLAEAMGSFRSIPEKATQAAGLSGAQQTAALSRGQQAAMSQGGGLNSMQGYAATRDQSMQQQQARNLASAQAAAQAEGIKGQGLLEGSRVGQQIASQQLADEMAASQQQQGIGAGFGGGIASLLGQVASPGESSMGGVRKFAEGLDATPKHATLPLDSVREAMGIEFPRGYNESNAAADVEMSFDGNNTAVERQQRELEKSVVDEQQSYPEGGQVTVDDDPVYLGVGKSSMAGKRGEWNEDDLDPRELYKDSGPPDEFEYFDPMEVYKKLGFPMPKKKGKR